MDRRCRTRGRAAAIFGLNGCLLMSLPALFTSLIEALGWRPAARALSVLLTAMLLIGTATQAISVGSAVNADSCRGLGESGLWIAIGVLAAMVLALWALLSQLLLWSDAAVLRVPQNVALAEQPGVNYAGSGESAQL